MSILSSGSGGFFGRRRNEAQQQATWEAYPGQEHHSSALGRCPQPPADFLAFPANPSPILNAHIEWKDTPESHLYMAHLPGYKRNDVRVEVDDDRVLSIICGKSVEKEEQRGGWHRVEHSSGHFVQRLTLPDNSIVDHVKAHMDNGVLTITVPKHYNRALNNRVRNINISSRP
ncbi:18.2 kDa class I heat shock protein, partial [Mucuna pruriens]